MQRTRVGYAGGSQANPTYRNLGDHTEVVQIDYDPVQISFQSLLALFWDAHNPTSPSYGKQYMSLILTSDASQQQLAESSKAQLEARRGRVFTEIKELGQFYLAEDYHQKYYLTRVRVLLREMREKYTEFPDFINSHLVARINGYVSGYGSSAMLGKEIDEFSLSIEAQRRLEDIVSAHS